MRACAHVYVCVDMPCTYPKSCSAGAVVVNQLTFANRWIDERVPHYNRKVGSRDVSFICIAV